MAHKALVANRDDNIDMINKHLNVVRRVESLTLHILRVYVPEITIELSPAIRQFYETISKEIANHGTVTTIAWVKTSRVCVMRMLSGVPLTYAEAKIPLDAQGFPLWIPKALKVSVPAGRELTPDLE